MTNAAPQHDKEKNTWPYVFIGGAQYRHVGQGWFIRIDGKNAGLDYIRDGKGNFVERQRPEKGKKK